jgi:SAM-dependent methyltransferase
MTTETPVQDKAGEDYWTSFWKSNKGLPNPALLSGPRDATYLTRQFDRFYSGLFQKKGEQGKKLLEIGCGNSVWLSFLSKEYGFQVYGLDYSEFGCEQTRRILQRDGCAGEIRYGDMFNPPEDWIGAFDVVCSFGVVEHFSDTVAAISAIRKFLKPGGLLITTIPNLNGPTGWLQRLLYKPVYDIHVVMDKKQLVDRLEQAGLSTVQSSYFCTFSFGVALESADAKPVRFKSMKKLLVKVFQSTGILFRWIDDHSPILPKGKFTSEGIFTAARNPTDA